MRTALTLATLLAASLSPAFADVKYDYTGNPFNQFNGASGDTIANFVTISVTLSAALPNSQALTTASPISFDISDGVHTITDATPGVIFTTFQFGTDLTGAINHWLVIADTNSVGLQSFDHLVFYNDGVQSVPSFDLYADRSSNGVDASNSLAAGTWSAAESVPEPSSLGLVLAGAAGFFWRRCKAN